MREKNRMRFFHEILGFLDESDPMALKELGLTSAPDKLSPKRRGRA